MKHIKPNTPLPEEIKSIKDHPPSELRGVTSSSSKGQSPRSREQRSCALVSSSGDTISVLSAARTGTPEKYDVSKSFPDDVRVTPKKGILRSVRLPTSGQ
jgi:hypothetical protein